MTPAGYSGTPLPKKLAIKDGSMAAAIAAPQHFSKLLVPLPSGVRIRSDVRAKGPFDVLVAFVRTEAELQSRFDRAHARLHPEGATICMVTHDPRYATVADRSVHLFDGQVVDEEDAQRAEHAQELEESGFDV